MPETYGTPDHFGFVYFVPEAERTSARRSTQSVDLPAVSRVIGAERFFDLPALPTISAGPPVVR